MKKLSKSVKIFLIIVFLWSTAELIFMILSIINNWDAGNYIYENLVK
jgi:hypothetical protein